MNKITEISEIVGRVVKSEKLALIQLESQDFKDVESAIKFIYSSVGKVVVSGIGKSALVAQKMVATLNSTGTSSVFLHGSDAMHGDIGLLNREDIVFIVSKSGGTRELVELISFARNKGVQSITLTNNPDSLLARKSDVSIVLPTVTECDDDNIVPTASIIAHLAICDAIAISLQRLKGFGAEEFAALHPSGTLGKSLNQSAGSLASKNNKPTVNLDTSLQAVIYEMSSNRLGACCVVNEKNELKGIITDGDIRRMLENNLDLEGIVASDIMTTNPKTVNEDLLAITLLDIMKKESITQMIVVDEELNYKGIVHIHDLINE